jgi:allophanate hydrolase
LLNLYRSNKLRPSDVVEYIYARIADRGDDHVWIYLIPKAEAMERARHLERSASDSPLYGVPFAVKDLFDVNGLATTAACPTYSYTATGTATVVQGLLDAGAILIGKANLDQLFVAWSTPIAKSPHSTERTSGRSGPSSESKGWPAVPMV